MSAAPRSDADMAVQAGCGFLSLVIMSALIVPGLAMIVRAL